jgi:hypothetical protein
VIIFAFHLTQRSSLSTIAIVGHITTPAQCIIGSTLAEILSADLHGVPAVSYRTDEAVCHSIAVWFVLHFIISDAQTLGILIVETGMPTATARRC